MRRRKDRRLLYGRQATTPGGSFKQSIDKTNSFNRPQIYLFPYKREEEKKMKKTVCEQAKGGDVRERGERK